MDATRLVGHRGYPARYPENTLISLEAAIRAGAKYIETDVQLSRDQVPVLFHDRDLRRLCGETGAIHDYSLEELARFRASDFDKFGYKFAQTPIPTLAEFADLLEQYPDVTAFVELKRNSLKQFGIAQVVANVLRILRKVMNQSVIISYSLPGLQAARNYGFPQIGAVFDDWKIRQDSTLLSLNPEYVFCDVDGLPRLGSLKIPGRKTGVFDVTDPRLAIKLADRGIDLIETFEIGEMIQALRQ